MKYVGVNGRRVGVKSRERSNVGSSDATLGSDSATIGLREPPESANARLQGRQRFGLLALL